MPNFLIILPFLFLKFFDKMIGFLLDIINHDFLFLAHIEHVIVLVAFLHII